MKKERLRTILWATDRVRAISLATQCGNKNNCSSPVAPTDPRTAAQHREFSGSETHETIGQKAKQSVMFALEHFQAAEVLCLKAGNNDKQSQEIHSQHQGLSSGCAVL